MIMLINTTEASGGIPQSARTTTETSFRLKIGVVTDNCEMLAVSHFGVRYWSLETQLGGLLSY